MHVLILYADCKVVKRQNFTDAEKKQNVMHIPYTDTFCPPKFLNEDSREKTFLKNIRMFN